MNYDQIVSKIKSRLPEATSIRLEPFYPPNDFTLTFVSPHDGKPTMQSQVIQIDMLSESLIDSIIDIFERKCAERSSK